MSRPDVGTAGAPATRRGLLSAGFGAVACARLDRLNAVGLLDRGGRRIARDVAYGDDPRQTFDLYGPAISADDPALPVVVFFHGGRRQTGSPALCARFAQALAARGFLVALPGYRVFAGSLFLAFASDAAAAVARVAEVASRYGGDPDRLGVAGHSAGADLALMIALDRRYMAAVEHSDLIRAVAGLAGPCERQSDPTLTRPDSFVRPDAPPLWLGHCAKAGAIHDDDLVVLNRRMQAVGGRSEARPYARLGQGDTSLPFSTSFRREASVLDAMGVFFRRELAAW